MFPAFKIQKLYYVAFYLFIVYFKKENEIMALSLKWYVPSPPNSFVTIFLFDLKIENEIFVVYGLDIDHERSANPFTKNRDNIDEVEDGMFLEVYGKIVSGFLFVYFNYVFLNQYQPN